ncbi:MAG: hypothetical protein KAU01_09525 [Candidatus Cloacimonetes bacterium]|nr:hypothetical protein [Candidatus Cloacimonadota bacterium]
MNKKLIIIILILCGIIFVHHYNKHKILIYSRQYYELSDIYKSKKDINLNLVSINSKLGSRERIQNLAFEKLEMFYPDNDQNIHNIKMNNKKKSFCLIDYIVPSAEALTK